MEKLTVYKALDGTLFEAEESCLNHDLSILVNKMCLGYRGTRLVSRSQIPSMKDVDKREFVEVQGLCFENGIEIEVTIHRIVQKIGDVPNAQLLNKKGDNNEKNI